MQGNPPKELQRDTKKAAKDFGQKPKNANGIQGGLAGAGGR